MLPGARQQQLCIGRRYLDADCICDLLYVAAVDQLIVCDGSAVMHASPEHDTIGCCLCYFYRTCDLNDKHRIRSEVCAQLMACLSIMARVQHVTNATRPRHTWHMARAMI